MDNMEFIANGSRWNVYKYEDVEIDGRRYLNPIIKKSRYNEIKDYLHNDKVHKKIKHAGVPVIAYCDHHLLNSENVLICENLNKNNTFFVSPNTVRPYSLSVRMKSLGIKESNVNISFEEKFCLENPIYEINNFDALLARIKLDMRTLSKHDVCMFVDAFFFGRNKDKVSVDVSYIIADFDNIKIDSTPYEGNLAHCNIRAGIEALQEYVYLFVSESSENKDFYINQLQAEYDQYN